MSSVTGGTGLAIVLFAMTVGLGGGLALYALVRAEHDRRVTDRETAERLARRDRD
ncbi:hypothetical protein [Halococcoides cellulosivorans]|uniref:hypothetical protein n=1 Tax=Halococcoides cellulosivorans TaxID=1679096 RepID=UPI00131F0B02|nr:hypothetical protein [Halococcoides cellulosivorans]